MTTRRRRTNSNSEDKENYPVVNAKGNRTYVSSGTAYEATKSYGLPVDDIDAGMTCRDRTNEFMSAVKSIQTRQVGFVMAYTFSDLPSLAILISNVTFVLQI